MVEKEGMENNFSASKLRGQISSASRIFSAKLSSGVDENVVCDYRGGHKI